MRIIRKFQTSILFFALTSCLPLSSPPPKEKESKMTVKKKLKMCPTHLAFYSA